MTKLTELHIDVNGLQPAVLKEVETKIGHSLGDLMKPGKYQADAIWALAYAVGHREDPELTWDEAGELRVYLENAPVPPTSGAG